MCCGRSPVGPAAESSAKEERQTERTAARETGATGKGPSGHVFRPGRVAFTHILGD